MSIKHIKIIAYSIIAIAAGTWQIYINYIGLYDFYTKMPLFKQFTFSIIIIFGIISLLTSIVKIVAKIFFPSLVYSKNNPVILKE